MSESKKQFRKFVYEEMGLIKGSPLTEQDRTMIKALLEKYVAISDTALRKEITRINIANEIAKAKRVFYTMSNKLYVTGHADYRIESRMGIDNKYLRFQKAGRALSRGKKINQDWINDYLTTHRGEKNRLYKYHDEFIFIFYWDNINTRHVLVTVIPHKDSLNKYKKHENENKLDRESGIQEEQQEGGSQ